MRRVVSIALVWMLTSTSIAGAQESTTTAGRTTPQPKTLERIIVTATKVETPAEQVGAAVTVVTEEEFQTFHYPTVEEALRHVPGVEIRRSGSFGKTTSVSIRGANPNQVQVLVDGMRVKSPTLGQADLADISPDLIERIEVIRGPQSTLYGADAIGGVVNIITTKGKGPLGASLSQEAGNLDTLRSRATVSGAWRRFDYAVSAYHLESNGQFINDGVDQNAFNLRLGVSLPWDSSLSLVLRWNQTNIGIPIEFVANPLPIVPTIDPNTRSESETLVTALSARTRPVPWWESEVRLGRYWNTLAFIDPPDPFGCPPITFGPPCDFPGRFEVERREAEWLNHFHLGKWSTSTVGLEYRHEEANIQGTTPFGPETWTRSGFFQEQLRFFERLFIVGGVRVEDHRVFGTEVTERGSLAFVIKETGTRIRGGAGTGFRAPTFNDLFFPGFSNPTLKPEKSLSYDLGVDQKLWQNRARLGLTYFQNNFTDLIICCVPIPVFPFATTANIGRARTAGIEFSTEVDVLDNVVVGVNYTYTDSENLLTDKPLPREPRHRWDIRVTWEPVKRLSLFTEVVTRSRQFEITEAGTGGGIFNRGHTRVDGGGTYRLVDRYRLLQGLDLTARVQNLLDERYAEVRGFPALGITGLVGLRASF